MSFFADVGGIVLALFGASLVVALCCAGSARGTGIAGEAASGLLSDDPSKLGKAMFLQLLPGTQGLYGFALCFVVFNQMGLFAGSAMDITVAEGMCYFAACLPTAIGGGVSAVAQGRVAAGAINLMARRPNDWTKGIFLCSIVEFYAILSLIVSIVMILNIG